MALALGLVALAQAALCAREAARPPPPPALPRPLRPDLNRAPARLLQLLPRVGPVRARAIVDERLRAGPYRSVGELARVRGIGPRTVERIEPLARAADLRSAPGVPGRAEGDRGPPPRGAGRPDPPPAARASGGG